MFFVASISCFSNCKVVTLLPIYAFHEVPLIFIDGFSIKFVFVNHLNLKGNRFCSFLLSFCSSCRSHFVTMDAVRQRFAPARNAVLLTIITAGAVCASGLLGWWAFLPLIALQTEFVARLYDMKLFGRVTKRPSPKHAFENPEAIYTWQELAQHNTEESAWVSYEGRVFDITDFIDRHPGGRELILYSTGRDITDLFKSYHPFTSLPEKVLNKYQIGSLSTYEHPVYKPDSGFYKEACEAVKNYFEENKINSKDPLGMFYRMFPIYVVFFSAFYVVYCLKDVPMALRVILAVIMGASQGMPLTGWMHDASHASIGHSERWWWSIGRFALDYVSGSSMLSWRNQHVLGHHVYTNVMGADPDLPVVLNGDPRRLLPQQAWAWIYRWQHLYLPPLYGILGLKSRTQDFTEIFSQHKNGPIRVNPIASEDYLRLISSKCVWAFYRFVVPWVFCRALGLRQMVFLFLITEFMTGYWLAFNFQVSHVSSEADFLFADTKKRESGKCPAVFEEEWAYTQIKTTIDYGHGSFLATYFSGALNYQTIHHLFPTVSQAHYPKITPMVMKIAEKYGVKFQVIDNFSGALGAHIQHLRDLGLEGKPAELKME